MANLLDYLEEHGNVPFDEEPLNEADNLALCQLAYCELDRAIPWLDARRSITFAQAWRAYSARRGKALSKTERLFRAMASSKRFGRVRLAGFFEHFDRAVHEQFAAYTAILPDGTAYVAFRGTNNHISGWRENFMMSYMAVGAQIDAKRYLDAVGRLTSGPIHVGGHSKGGNLAAYAAAFCAPEVRDRIVAVWCNDSPGFVREVVDFDAFVPIVARMRLFVPEFCVVAGIMEQVVRPTVIRSAQRRHLQHDAMSWQVEGGKLARAETLAPECRLSGRVFHRLVYSRSRKERVGIVNSLFDAISQSGIETVDDFVGESRALELLANRLSACDGGTRAAACEVLVGVAAAAVTLPSGVMMVLDYPHVVPTLLRGAGALSAFADAVRAVRERLTLRVPAANA